MSQQLGFIGLGRMGKNIVLNLLEQGIGVVGFNRTKEVTEAFVKEASGSGRFIPVYTLEELVTQMVPPRVLFLMVPNGKPIDEMTGGLVAAGITKGDTIIDGGNSWYKDSQKRYEVLSKKGVQYIDCGTSGGLEGARHGACLMLGGEEMTVRELSWIWDAISVKDGWQFFGPTGAGHFVKMVHNAIEYGMNESIAEGFALLEKSPYKPDIVGVAKIWTRGSVVRGWLMELLASELVKDPRLVAFTGKTGGGQTGQWAVEVAKEFGVEVQSIEHALAARIVSRTGPSFGSKIVSALRHAYGGHKEYS